MMNVLLIINILLVVLYVGITIGRMRGLPESISAMVYELSRKWQWVWSAWLVAVAFTLMPVLLEKLPDGVEFLGFLTTIGLVGTAVTPLIQLETRKWHYIFAIGAGVLWGKKMQFDNGLGSMFALGILSSMLGGGWGNSNTGMDYLKKTLDEDEKKKEEQVYMIPEK